MMPFPMYQTPAPQPRFAPPTGFPQSPPQSFPQAANPRGTNPYPAPSSIPWQAAPASPVLAAQAAQINQPKARGYAPEPKAQAQAQAPAMPKAIQLPSPEELGLKSQPAVGSAMVLPAAMPATSPVAVDWNQTHARLRQMGAIAFTVNQLPDGMTRVILTLPTGQSGHSREVLAIGMTEAAAVASMFDRIGEVK